jgi:hypothetical protein
VRAKFWVEATRGSDDEIVSDGGMPTTGTRSTLALLYIMLAPALPTVTVHVIPEVIAGMLMVFKDDGIEDMSIPLQLQENVSTGCSFGPKLGSYDDSALMRPPELPMVIFSPPEIAATGGSRASSKDDTR